MNTTTKTPTPLAIAADEAALAKYKATHAAALPDNPRQTLWKAVKYGVIGNQVCRICSWQSYMPNGAPKKFTLHPVDGGSPYCGLNEGEFTRYSEQENEIVRIMLAQRSGDAYESVWKD